uniref:Uncharacterized protein n=1 Tax=Hyaloperonospora arabidopsidis (strain Emoy2) TaxID=559515 RepID=M4BLM0_HYAAE
MDHLLNQQPNASFPDDSSTPDDNVVIKNEASKSAPDPLFVSASQTLPHLTSRLMHSVVSPNSSAASLGLHMLSSSAAAPPSRLTVPDSSPPRLPPISLLTAAAATLQQPMQCYPRAIDPPYHLRPLLVTPLAYVAPAAPASTLTSLPQSSTDRPQLDDRLCRYRNKKCGYPRAIKRNGERHNLCEHHRAKANQNQRKLESKRRVKKRMVADRVDKEKKMVVSPEFKLTLYGDTTFA